MFWLFDVVLSLWLLSNDRRRLPWLAGADARFHGGAAFPRCAVSWRSKRTESPLLKRPHRNKVIILSMKQLFLDARQDSWLLRIRQKPFHIWAYFFPLPRSPIRVVSSPRGSCVPPANSAGSGSAFPFKQILTIDSVAQRQLSAIYPLCFRRN